MYESSPISSTAAGDTAVVNDYSTTVTTYPEGKRKRSVTRVTEVLIKDGKKWMLFSGSTFEATIKQQ